jgi:hypothetical protein
VGDEARLLGVGAIAQGVLLIAISSVALERAIQAAEILYAEDFDRMDHVPTWFAPWHLAMRDGLVSHAALFLSGLALVLTGSHLAGTRRGLTRWFEGACWTAMICSLSLALALIPLYLAGDGWPYESPAGHLRRRLLTTLAAAWLETLTLVGTVSVVRATRRWEAHSGAQSESEA